VAAAVEFNTAAATALIPIAGAPLTALRLKG
jgi:hypothetical protein